MSLEILKCVFLILENKYMINLIYLIHTSFLKMKLGVCKIGSGQIPRLPTHTVSTAIVIILAAIVVTRMVAAVFRST